MELPQKLRAALLAADEEYLTALCNRGTVNRAKKDLASTQPEARGTDGDAVTLAVGDAVCTITAPLGNSICSCPSSAMCRHRMAAILWLKEQSAQTAPPPGGNRRPSGGRAAGRDGGGAGRPALRLSHSDAHPAAGRTPGIRPDPAGAPRPGGVHPGGQHRDRGPAVVSRHGTPDRAFGAQQLHLPQPELLSPQGGGPAHLAAAPRRCDRGRPAVRARTPPGRTAPDAARSVPPFRTP